MNAPIEDALDQVRRMQELVLERRRFQGYSGWARMASGAIALIGAFLLAHGGFAAAAEAHLRGWAAVLAAALVLNYGALAGWIMVHPEVRRNPVMLKPALDALPALAAGGALTLALIQSQRLDLLFGSWMMMYGLAQTAYRNSLPRGIYFTGLVYLVCGAALLLRAPPFTNPWPMGIVFLLGELAGGLSLITQERT